MQSCNLAGPCSYTLLRLRESQASRPWTLTALPGELPIPESHPRKPRTACNGRILSYGVVQRTE